MVVPATRPPDANSENKKASWWLSGPNSLGIFGDTYAWQKGIRVAKDAQGDSHLGKPKFWIPKLRFFGVSHQTICVWWSGSPPDAKVEVSDRIQIKTHMFFCLSSVLQLRKCYHQGCPGQNNSPRIRTGPRLDQGKSGWGWTPLICRFLQHKINPSIVPWIKVY